MLKKLILAAAALTISAPALADNGHRHKRHQWKHQHRAVIVRPAPRVFYAPPPVYYYAPPAPVYYAPPPVYYPRPVEPSISIGVRLPL